MLFKNNALVLASMLMLGAPATAWAYGGGGPGCSDLPEYYRAVGALQGLSVCDMTIEQARQVIRAYGGAAAAEDGQVAPRPRHRHHADD